MHLILDNITGEVYNSQKILICLKWFVNLLVKHYNSRHKGSNFASKDYNVEEFLYTFFFVIWWLEYDPKEHNKLGHIVFYSTRLELISITFYIINSFYWINNYRKYHLNGNVKHRICRSSKTKIWKLKLSFILYAP